MIYQFPDLDTLRLAVLSGVVPPEASLAPAVGGIDADGRPWLEPATPLSRKAQAGLRRLGTQTGRANEPVGEPLSCWLQLLPVGPDPSPPALSAQAPVLFELADGQRLPGLVGEMLRLGNDRQGFRWLKDEDGDRAFLRVIGPPYYSLLQAIDRVDAAAPRAYIERAPRVWVEIGRTHPLVEMIRPPEKRLLLMRAPRDWRFLEDVPFQDIYDVLEFQLPHAPVIGQAQEMAEPLRVPLRLTAGNAIDPAELWVVRDRALARVDELVRNSDDHLIGRLSFAVTGPADAPVIILRVRPSKQAAPSVPIEAEAYRSFQKFTNLFLPCGTGLKPPLRRDAVRRLLAADPDQVVWLAARGEGRFVPESLPDAAFRPLPDWVDYVLDHDHLALQAWVEAARFDFAAYICKDDVADSTGTRPRAPGREKGPRPEDAEVAPGPDVPAPKVRKGTRPVARVEEPASTGQAEMKPSEAQVQIGAMQQEFLASTGPLDAPDRQQLWPRMASLHARLGETADAAICWMNALWEEEEPVADWAGQWARAELKAAVPPVRGIDLDQLLAIAAPTSYDIRALAACVVAAVDGPESGRQALLERLPRLQASLRDNEARLGARAVWLAWTALARLSAGDVLNLARTRDRLLERLLASGLSAEYDLATFLRFAGQRSTDRFRAVRERIFGLHDQARRWVQRCNEKSVSVNGAEPTLAYTDLMFAFGLARMGEVNQARALQQQARDILGPREDETHSFLLESFTYRIEQAIAGRAHAGSLPGEQLEWLQDMEARTSNEKTSREALYRINRMRQRSRILDPQDVVDAFRLFKAGGDALERELVHLAGLPAGTDVAGRLRGLLRAEKRLPMIQKVLAVALEVAPRLGEEFAVEMLGRLTAAQLGSTAVVDLFDLEERARVLERALFLSAHYDRSENLQRLVGDFIRLLESQRGDQAVKALGTLAGQCLRGLRKLGLRDEIDLLLRRMTDLIVQGQPLDVLRQRQGGHWPVALETLLHIASGWLYFGRAEQAMPFLDEARDVLCDEAPVEPATRTNLACTFIAALGQAPPLLALERIEELFRRMGRITDTFTTSSHYSIQQLRVIEAVVLAVVSDDFSLGQNVRRWLDEDEYLVRRRIHRDLRSFMGRAGL